MITNDYISPNVNSNQNEKLKEKEKVKTQAVEQPYTIELILEYSYVNINKHVAEDDYVIKFRSNYKPGDTDSQCACLRYLINKVEDFESNENVTDKLTRAGSRVKFIRPDRTTIDEVDFDYWEMSEVIGLLKNRFNLT